jgi:cell shape-determining protein MreC
MRSLRVFVLTFFLLAIIFSLSFFRADISRFLSSNRPLSQKAQTLSTAEEPLLSDRYEYQSALVYSRYPFNNRALLTIDLGEDSNIKEGMPVLAEGEILLGRVKEVKRTQSEVETIFNPGWKSSVVVGNSRTKALLVGGDSPELQLVPQDSRIKEGNIVMNISPDFPANLSIGQVTGDPDLKDEVWLSFQVEPSFQIEDIEKVFVVTNFP